jgi:hypothetical protein
MLDTAGHGAPQHANDGVLHTMSLDKVAEQLMAAGVPRSHRHIVRLCKTGLFDAKKFPGGSGDEWFVAPDSVPRAIGDLVAMQQRRERHATPQPATSDHDAPKLSPNSNTDTAGHGALQPATPEAENNDERRETGRATARQGVTELDIYEHPYVKRLEDRVEKLEAKYEAQVRRTEEIQLKGQEKLLELQRMTAVGQSQTLADFMLKAKDWVLGSGSEGETREVNDPINP